MNHVQPDVNRLVIRTVPHDFLGESSSGTACIALMDDAVGYRDPLGRHFAHRHHPGIDGRANNSHDLGIGTRAQCLRVASYHRFRCSLSRGGRQRTDQQTSEQQRQNNAKTCEHECLLGAESE